MIKKKILFFTLILSISFLCKLNAQTDPETTVALSEKLNELGMYDHSFDLLDIESRKYPAYREKFQIQRAATHFANREEEKGMNILKRITSGSKYFNFSKLALGKYYVTKKRYKEAITPLEAYCTSVKNNPPSPEEKFKAEELKKAVAYLQHAYKELGNTKKAVAVMRYLEVIRPPKKKKTKYDVFQELVFESQVKLDIAEQNRKEKKENWQDDVKDAMIPLAKILKDPSEPSIVTVMAFTEQLKGAVLLGKIKDAENLVKAWKDMTLVADDIFAKENLLHEAPSAKMYLWIAELNLLKAKKEEDKAKRIALNTKAITDFYRVFTEYDSKLCPYIPAAASGFNRAKMALEKDDKIVEAEVQPPVNFNLDRANMLYDKAVEEFTATIKLTGEAKKQKNEEAKKAFEKVIPVILKYLREDGGKNTDHALDMFSKLTDSYIKAGKMFEALALAGFMADCYPDSPNTPVLLLLVGEIKWKEYKKNPNTPEGKRAKENALIAYEWYTQSCPTHRNAADISAMITMEAYGKAAAMAERANNMPDGPGEIGEAKLKANLEAREEFKKIIPKFKYIVDNYSHTKRGKEAAFIMGNCYSNSCQFIEGSKVFEKYCDLETNHPKKNERDMGRVADAKFRMADNYVKYAESIQKEAYALKEKLEAAPEEVPEGSKEKTKAEVQKEIDAKKAEAVKYFELAIKNFREFTDNWTKPGGRLHALGGENGKKVENLLSHTLAYIPWVYDRSGDKEKTIRAFSEFLKKFPDHDSVPEALKRRAFIYIAMGETEKAAKDFDVLSSKFPEKAKTIQYDLAKAMYEIKNYNKSIEAAAKLLEGKMAEITVYQLRWIARSFIDCGGKHPKEGAALSLKASNELLVRLKKPVLIDWVNQEKAAEYKADKDKREKNLKIIKDQVLLVAADAAFFSEDYNQALKYLNIILSDENTPYFFSAHFKRAQVYRKMDKFQEALKDYGEISNVLIGDPNAKESMSFKTQLLAAITYIQMGDLPKAKIAMVGTMMAAMPSDAKDSAPLAGEEKEIDETEKALQSEYTEYALFLTACIENKMGNKDKAEELTDIYKKVFHNGKLKSSINVLPPPTEAIKKVKIEVF